MKYFSLRNAADAIVNVISYFDGLPGQCVDIDNDGYTVRNISA